MSIINLDFNAELAVMNSNLRINTNKIIGNGLPKPPSWLIEDDELSLLYSEFPELIDKGKVYWAAVVQANKSLFTGSDDFVHTKPSGSLWNRALSINAAAFDKPLISKPTGASVATLIYNHKSPKTSESDPLIMKTLAHYIFECKNKPEEEIPSWLTEAARVIKADYDRSQVIIKAGEKDDFSMNVTMLTIIVFREHLPKGFLKGNIMPIIAAPKKCRSAIILPCDYWSKGFAKYFRKLPS